MAPKISVILPVYNAGKYLAPAIRSILDQTLSDFELIIINDGSTDGSDRVLDSFHDPRLKVINQPNQGVQIALNTGLSLAKGEYIARMDHDDISDPRRLAQQAAFLDSHRDHIVVGTTYAYIDQAEQVTGVFPALLDDVTIRRELLTKSPFGHGSVLMRASIFHNHDIKYRSNLTDDYDLWFQLQPYGKFANLPAVLYYWRHITTGITHVHRTAQQAEARAIRDRVMGEQKMNDFWRWPGWSTVRRYRNEHIQLQGRPYTVARRSAHCSLYLNLALLLWRHSRYLESIQAGIIAVCISPWYVLSALRRRSKGTNV